MNRLIRRMAFQGRPVCRMAFLGRPVGLGRPTYKGLLARSLLLEMRLNLSRSLDILSAFSVPCKDGFSESHVTTRNAGVGRGKLDVYSVTPGSCAPDRSNSSFPRGFSAGSFRELTEHELAIHVENPSLGNIQSCSTNHTPRIASTTKKFIRSPPITGRCHRHHLPAPRCVPIR